jgi:hypothetical protein
MSVIEHPAHHHPVVGTGAPGQPGTGGRWQPTRAGVVNSWAWAEETFWFADGWLALTGPNGSGKSLTASMLITALLDGDMSQTALSVSGKAAGTLTSRHTDRNERDDRTGIWWLEYGLRDTASRQTRHLTTGLWLRSSGGDLHRAFFITPGRAGTDLVLQRDREPVRIDDLAEQLSTGGGELFTSSAKLLPKALAHLRAVAEEADYRRSIRTRLFAPLEEVQFEALVGVLRSLRSVRTAEAISPKQMCAVLTDALPALDPERLTVIAESMERIADLEKQLQRTRTETSLLETADKAYRRYLNAVAQREAAALTAANSDFDDQTRKEREATAGLRAARDRQADLKARHTEARIVISELEGLRDAADAALRDHAGAELPHMERRAEESVHESDRAAERAAEAQADAQAAAEQAEASASTSARSQEHLATLNEQLRADAAKLGADAAVERLLAVAQELATAHPGPTPATEIGQLSATPLAWAEARGNQVRAVQETLRGHARAQQAEKAVAQDRSDAEDEEDARRDTAGTAAGQRQDAEQALREALTGWAASARHLGPVPEELTVADDDADHDRLDPDRLTAWLSESVNAARHRIGLARHEQAAVTDAALAAVAAAVSQETREAHAKADQAATEATTSYSFALEQARAETKLAEQQKDQAIASHQDTVAAANANVGAAEQRLADGTDRARHAALDWIGSVRAWQARLVHLSRTELRLPAPDASPAELDSLAPASLRVLIANAHATAAARLERAVAQAQHGVQRAEEFVGSAEADLAEARRAAPVPAMPPWRTRRPGDGIPLWALVDFSEHLPAAQADRLEGALLVSGLLDALVTPDGHAVAGDLIISPAAAGPGHTLADFLQVEPDPAVDAGYVRRLLRAIPVDAPGSDLGAGKLANGVLTATAPSGYRAAFIGRTARERARLARVTALESELTRAEEQLSAARGTLRARQDDVQAARAERDAFPAEDSLTAARDHASQLLLHLAAAQQQASEQIGKADLALQQTLAELERAADARATALAATKQAMDQAQQTAADAGTKAEAAATTAARKAEEARRSEQARQNAANAQQQADSERDAFPTRQLQQVRATHQAEDEAGRELDRARAALVKAGERHRLASEEVRAALRQLNDAAALPGGSLLPTHQAALDDHGDAVRQLGHGVEMWGHAARRTIELLHDAARDSRAAAKRASTAARRAEEAQDRRLEAARQASAVAEARRLYGAEYEKLAADRRQVAEELEKANTDAGQLLSGQFAAAEDAAAAQATLDGIAPQREAAERHRDRCLRDLGRLIDEGLATMPEDLPADTSGRPANLTTGLAWARRLLGDQSAGPDRLSTLTQARTRALSSLEGSARTASTALARFSRQVTVFTIEGTDWRRAVVADPEAARGEDLHLTVEGLRRAAEQLDADLRDDVKQTMKTGLFTQLRRDIQLRREAAQQLVRQIRTTLGGVRTGVAKVGIEVEWSVRKDEDAQRMVELISQPPSDEVFDQMYAVLRQRMDEAAGEEWKDRVAHTFDYRAWHEWRIWVTHSSFGDSTAKERFREVTSRSNPLESLSTGERRLATMLPLLAAAWSMYASEAYKGPRLLSIDEIDAAFDEPNLRQMLALLRSWRFDVLATAPSMTPMIKRETGHVVVHQVTAAGKRRVTVPWLWEGHGEPQPLTLELGSDQPQEHA